MTDSLTVFTSDWAQIYDAMDLDRSPLVAFYSSLVDASATDLLDFGCGTGSITLKVAAQMAPNPRVVGVDLSTRMIDLARARAPQHDWIVSDFTSVKVEGKFDLAMVCYVTMQTLLDPQDFASTLRNAAARLKPGGRFAFDMYQPNPEWLAKLGPEPNYLRSFKDEGGKVYDVYSTRAAYDAEKRLVSADWIVRDPDTGREMPMPPLTLRFRQYYPEEVRAEIERAGLRVDAAYGDFDRRPLAPGTKMQIYVCSLA